MNFFDIWPWWLWALNGLGITGIIALAIFAPALLGAICTAILKFLDRAIRTPLGAGIIGLAVGFGAGHFEASERAIETCNTRIEDMKQTSREMADARDKAIGKMLEDKFGPINRKLGEQEAGNQKLVDTYAQTITALPSGSQCPLGAGPLRLRQRK